MSSSSTPAPPVLGLTLFIERASQRLAEHTDPALWTAPSAELTDLVLAMEKFRARFDAAHLAVIREVDRRDAAKTLGAPTTASWLRNGPALLSPREATRLVRLGRDLDRTLHTTRHALTAGELSVEHAAVIARTLKDLPAEVDATTRADAERVLVERVLVERAQTFNPNDLALIGKTILDVVAPDLADKLLSRQLADAEQKAARARELTLTPDPYQPGSYFFRGKLDPETAEMLKTALDPLAKPRPKDATGERDPRSYPERMGDALHEFLRLALDRGDVVPTHAGNRPHVVITVDQYSWLTGSGYGRFLMSQQPVSMESLYRIACDALVTVIERGAKPGDVKDARRTRIVTGWLRLQLHLRDKGCAFPGCDKPPAHCEAHHLIPWHRGGPTVLENLVLLCRYHHKLMDQPHWQARINPHDHLPEFIPPVWIDQQQQPLRNTRLQI